MTLAIGVDIGGTKLAAGVVDPAGRVIDRARRATPGADIVATEQTIVELVELLRTRHQIATVGVGAAGWLSADRSTIMFSPHLAWRGEPLQARLAARIDIPVLVDNDGNASAWAEYRFGAGAGARVLVGITLGTGIGGGLVIDGRLVRGAFGAGAEFGHMTVVPDGRQCECGRRGCWEMYASGTALAEEGRELAGESPAEAVALLELAGGEPAAITGELVQAAARAGDLLAIRACTAVGDWLGRGLVNLAAALDPDRFVIGGGVGVADGLILGPARARFHADLPGGGYRPEADIAVAALGSEAGIVGGADLARREHLEGQPI